MIFYSEEHGLVEIAFYDYTHFCIILSDADDEEFNADHDFFYNNYEFIGFI